jgi:hypothetical protein
MLTDDTLCYYLSSLNNSNRIETVPESNLVESVTGLFIRLRVVQPLVPASAILPLLPGLRLCIGRKIYCAMSIITSLQYSIISSRNAF